MRLTPGISPPSGQRCRSEGPHRENWPALLAFLDSDQVSGDRALARPVEFREEDALPLSEADLSLEDRNGHVVTEQRRAEVRVSVLPLAVRTVFAVVEVTVLAVHQSLEALGEVRHQGRLEFIQEERGGGVERREDEETGLDARCPDLVAHPVADVVQFHARIRDHFQRPMHDLHLAAEHVLAGLRLGDLDRRLRQYAFHLGLLDPAHPLSARGRSEQTESQYNKRHQREIGWPVSP